ncbi:unnamed protein product [Rhodiola kirilowii]
MATTSTTMPMSLVAALLILIAGAASVSGRVLLAKSTPSPKPQNCKAFNVTDLPHRATGQDVCSESDIVIDQGPSAPLPNGIPTYSVTITNTCSSGCDIGGIHMKCGKFSTARLIDPDIFKRLDYDDCLVYGGKPLPNGLTLSFEYANTYPYPMDVSQYELCC